MKRRDPQMIGQVPGLPAVTLTLSVLLCIGALSDGSAAAAAVAQSLGRHGTTAGERESVATLLSNLNEAARKLCKVQSGQPAHAGRAADEPPACDTPTALRPYDHAVVLDARPPIGVHLLNLPPPAATL